MGAWIEILMKYDIKDFPMSHPLWVRGLKCFGSIWSTCISLSHHLWVRGLKSNVIDTLFNPKQSHPLWVRGLKSKQDKLKKIAD